MLALRGFLGQYACDNEAAPNLGSLKGGLWKVPREKRSEFFKLYCAAAKTFTAKDHTGFVFRPPRTLKQPFLLDIDFKTTKEVPNPVEPYVELAEIVAKELQRQLKQPIAFAVVCKPNLLEKS